MAKQKNNVEVNQSANENNQTANKIKQNDSGKAKKNQKTRKQNEKPKRNLVKESVGEIKKITWPTFGEVVKNTLIVLAIVLICTAALFLIDRVLSWLYQLMIDGNVTNWWF